MLIFHYRTSVFTLSSLFRHALIMFSYALTFFTYAADVDVVVVDFVSSSFLQQILQGFFVRPPSSATATIKSSHPICS